jgi:hypothetical protein
MLISCGDGNEPESWILKRSKIDKSIQRKENKIETRAHSFKTRARYLMKISMMRNV